MGRRHHKRTGFVDWRGRASGIPVRTQGQPSDHLPKAKAMTTPDPDVERFEVLATDGTVMRTQVEGVLISPGGWMVPRSQAYPYPEPILMPPMPPIDLTARFVSMREALDRFREAMDDIPPFPVYRGGIQYERGHEAVSQWDISAYRKQDPRQGEEVYVYDLLPGARVYVLEDVFTVARVELKATPPTVWLKELPTSPLYFTEDEYIYLANETED